VKPHKGLTFFFDYAGPMTETVLMGICLTELASDGTHKVVRYFGEETLWKVKTSKHYLGRADHSLRDL